MKNRIVLFSVAVILGCVTVLSVEAQTIEEGTVIVGPPQSGKEVKISRCIKSFSITDLELELGSASKCKTGQGQCRPTSCV